MTLLLPLVSDRYSVNNLRCRGLSAELLVLVGLDCCYLDRDLQSTVVHVLILRLLCYRRACEHAGWLPVHC